MSQTIEHVGGATVALVSGGGILSELIHIVISELRDVSVVQEIVFEGFDSMAAAVRQSHPDVVVWVMDDDSNVAQHPALLGDGGWPIIAVLDDGRRSATWELRPSRTELGPPSYDSLVKALRAATTRS